MRMSLDEIMKKIVRSLLGVSFPETEIEHKKTFFSGRDGLNGEKGEKVCPPTFCSMYFCYFHQPAEKGYFYVEDVFAFLFFFQCFVGCINQLGTHFSYLVDSNIKTFSLYNKK